MAASVVEQLNFYDAALETELIARLLNDDSLAVRRSAALAMRNPNYHTDATREALVKTIQGMTDFEYSVREVASAAAYSLAGFGPQVINDLIPVLLVNPEANWFHIRTVWDNQRADAAARLAELLAHDEVRVRNLAHSALARLGPEAVPHVVRQLSSEANDRTRQEAAAVLYGLGTRAKAALPSLLELAASGDLAPNTRIAAARAALAVDLESARQSEAIVSRIPELIAALSGPDFRLRGQAAETLGLIGPAAREALPALRRSLELPPPGFDTGGLIREYVRNFAELAIATIEIEQE
jgi:HEAT repeat protein